MKNQAMTRMAVALLALGWASCDARSAEDATALTTSALEPSASTACGNDDWSTVSSPNQGGGDNALASVSGSCPADVWAVGQFAPDANPNITLTLAEHFDGGGWSVVDTPNVGTNRGNALLAVTSPGAGHAFAVGYFIGDDYLAHGLIEAWDGHAWRIARHPAPFETDNLYGVAATAPDDVWAVGSGRDGQGIFRTLVVHFDGRRWSLVPSPSPGAGGDVLYGVVAKAPNDAWAVGQTIGSAPPDASLVEHWDGTRWSVVPTDAPAAEGASAQLLAVDASRRGTVVAVGDAQDGLHSLKTFAAASLARERWSVRSTPNPTSRDNRLTGVALAGDHQTAWAVGSSLDDAGGNLSTLIVTGVGQQAWSRSPSPNPSAEGNNQLAAVAEIPGGGLWAVGAFDGPDAQQTLILHHCP